MEGGPRLPQRRKPPGPTCMYAPHSGCICTAASTPRPIPEFRARRGRQRLQDAPRRRWNRYCGSAIAELPLARHRPRVGCASRRQLPRRPLTPPPPPAWIDDHATPAGLGGESGRSKPSCRRHGARACMQTRTRALPEHDLRRRVPPAAAGSKQPPRGRRRCPVRAPPPGLRLGPGMLALARSRARPRGGVVCPPGVGLHMYAVPGPTSFWLPGTEQGESMLCGGQTRRGQTLVLVPSLHAGTDVGRGASEHKRGSRLPSTSPSPLGCSATAATSARTDGSPAQQPACTSAASSSPSLASPPPPPSRASTTAARRMGGRQATSPGTAAACSPAARCYSPVHVVEERHVTPAPDPTPAPKPKDDCRTRTICIDAVNECGIRYGR